MTLATLGPSLHGHRDLNMRAYDSVAEQYARRVSSDMTNDVPIVSRVMAEWARVSDGLPSVLDVGCAAGANLKMFHDEQCATTGIDISSSMVEIAKVTSPGSSVLCADVTEFSRTGQNFDIVFAKAFLHLYPKGEAPDILADLVSMLRPSGLLYLATTAHAKQSEGLEKKLDYRGQPRRFRSRWTIDNWRQLFSESKLETVSEWFNNDPRNGKRWMNTILAANKS